jgi:hypothetical protein
MEEEGDKEMIYAVGTVKVVVKTQWANIPQEEWGLVMDSRSVYIPVCNGFMF